VPDDAALSRRSVLLGTVAAGPLALAGQTEAAPTPSDKSPEFQFRLPRCDKMDGSTLRIVPSYIEAGMFREANCVTITDGERTALYVPLRIVTDDELEAERASWRRAHGAV
jgi:hypothetical protein